MPRRQQQQQQQQQNQDYDDPATIPRDRLKEQLKRLALSRPPVPRPPSQNQNARRENSPSMLSSSSSRNAAVRTPTTSATATTTKATNTSMTAWKRRPPPVNTALSSSSNMDMYHPPSLSSRRTGSNISNTIDNVLDLEAPPSLVRDVSTTGSVGGSSVVYHPPVNLDHSFMDEEMLERSRYRAALQSSFTPKGVADFNRNMDDRNVALQHALSSSTTTSTTTDDDGDTTTNYTTSTMGNHTSSTAQTTSTTACSHTYGASTTTMTNDNVSLTTSIDDTRRLPLSMECSTMATSAYSTTFSPTTTTNNHHHGNFLADDLLEQAEEDEYFRVKQPFGYCSMVISAIQLLVVMMQLALCGVAPLDVNPMVGPYPDVFSEWGGKNAYLIVGRHQIFRLVTPAFLHVGILHLLVNAYVQLETCAFFEREWGSTRWVLLYILSEVGCVAVSCVINPDTVAVGSSGAIIGLFGAKFAQLVTFSNFQLVVTKNPRIRLEQWSGIMCSLSIVALLSFVNYIDWSGHAGGFCTGFCCGMMVFAGPIENSMTRIAWILLGLTLTGLGFYATFHTLFTKTVTDADMADACEYFRNLYDENYQCECAWG